MSTQDGLRVTIPFLNHYEKFSRKKALQPLFDMRRINQRSFINRKFDVIARTTETIPMIQNNTIAKHDRGGPSIRTDTLVRIYTLSRGVLD